MEKSSQNEMGFTKKLSEKWAYVIGLSLIHI